MQASCFVSRRFFGAACTAVLATTVSTCRDIAPPARVSGAPLPPSFAQQARGPSRAETPWRRMTETQLSAEIVKAGGRVFIGFKEALADRGVDELGRVFTSQATLVMAKASVRSLGIEITMEFGSMPHVVARMPAHLLSQLRRNPLVEYVEPVTNYTLSSQQATTWNVQRVRAPESWPSSTGQGAVLLIVDTGIDYPHPDLAPTFVNGCDESDGIDVNGHGTGVIGVAAAVSNDIQHVGVAHGVSLWSSRAGPGPIIGSAAACAVWLGRTMGANVINLSFEGAPSTALTDQINSAYYQDGLVIVAAAGNTNGGPVAYPASLNAAIAVSATDTNNAKGVLLGHRLEG